jgi:hypothetical protein
MKLAKRTKLKIRNAFKSATSLLMAFVFLYQIFYPTQVWALTGGPSQPEVQSFEPIGTSDMVDLFSGDFNYNIPLMDVDGYPINIAYHSGVGMDQEASWVGLGWNINPGVVSRNMRGLPDDFDGDIVTKELNIKPNKTWGVAADLNIELYGYEGEKGSTSEGNSGSVTLGVSFGFNYNNYTGPSINQGVNLGLSAASKVGGLNAGLGVNSSSDDGLTIQPSAGFSLNVKKSENANSSIGGNIGTSFNSRGGLKQLSINASARITAGFTEKKVQKDKSIDGTSVQMGGSVGTGGTFDFGTPTSTPQITNNFKNYSYYFKTSLGGEIFGVNAKVGVSGLYSSQTLAQNVMTNHAYGYLYSQNGQQNDDALMDFNREKDGAYNENMAALPVTNYTFDTYGVSGQGVGGSYRPFRSEIGYVYDPSGYTTNDDLNIVTEVGVGNLVKLGTDISVTDVNGHSGKWKSNNDGIGKLAFTSKGKGNDYENVYFKEANEKTVDDDPAFYAGVGYDAPLSPSIDFSDPYEPVCKAFGPVVRKKRDKRTQNFYYLKKSEYSNFAVKEEANLYAAPASHIAEVTTLATDGSRYIYGIAAYNTNQKEVTFSVGSTSQMATAASLLGNNSGGNQLEATEGLYSYNSGDNSLSNTKGIDNFYSGTSTPAFAHSYLLTSVLSPDYIDNDNERGPSDKDFGSYTRFAYKKYDDYKWRVPFSKATYNEGLKSDKQDDKANYIYGTKELWYLDSVVTKNYIAYFHTSPRQDGVGVNDEEGGFGPGSKPMYKLDSISLYSKADIRKNGAAALVIKRVHFEYTYALCKNIPNSDGGQDPTKGKLTLKKIFFSYQNSNKARLSPYVFDYHETITAENPNYNIKAYDRWGNYKPNTATSIGVRDQTDIGNFVAGSLPASDFPYVDQNQTTANQYSSVWSLKEIQLPSGGKIKVSYESDDYAFVQNKQAMQMFNIVNIDNPSDASNTVQSFRNDGDDKFYFKLQTDHNGALITDINKYIQGISNLYFRFLVKIRRSTDLNYDHYEYVSGYGEIDPSKCGINSTYGYIGFKDVLLEEKRPEVPLVNPRINPILRTAIQYARIYMPKKAYAKDIGSIAQGDNIEGSSSFGLSVINALIGSDFTSNIKDAILGPNAALYAHPYHVGKEFVTNKSWVRLLNPSKKKLGGGCRVKKIEMSDEWQSMTGSPSASETTSYGQEYDYTLSDNTSSGVASYEPQLGGDENPFRQPLPYEIKKCMVPNDEFYQEDPFGESFFPTPSVGYSKVTVKNLSRLGVTRHATGKVVHEFYTSKEFPTITKHTNVEHIRAKDRPFSLAALLKIDVRDYLTASQGFVVELNDMHGKPKSQAVYQEGQTVAISSVTYKYKQQNYLDAFKLDNNCTTIKKDGSISSNRIGEFFDMVADFREEKTTTKNISVGINVDISMYAAYPVVVPTAWPSYAKQQTRYRSATTTKVIQRFGILDETIATDLGSVVATKNVAYDAETGGVLLTETTTNFNDKVYSLKYPAWWSYESMGPAYQNIGFEMNGVTFAGGTSDVGTAVTYFREGDELALSGTTNKTGWLKSISGSIIEVVDKAGAAVIGNFDLKVIRSGKRNMMTTDMATITTISNPISSISSNIYQNVLQAGAVEFANKRQTFCDCIGSSGSSLPASTNPYINGTRGNWRPLKSYTHLTARSQSNYDNNTNIRKDGVFVSYSPFYKNTSGVWVMDGKDWTYVSEVTEFNVLGEELENKDALGRYSSASFGYNQSMAISVAANARYQEQGFDGFEDYDYNPCVDDHFKFPGITPTTNESHTGKYSLKVSNGSSQTLTKQIAVNCTPTSECKIIINATHTSSSVYTIAFSNTTDPISVSWNIISGSPAIVPNSSGGFQINGSVYQVEITVMDSKGCSASQIITN